MRLHLRAVSVAGGLIALGLVALAVAGGGQARAQRAEPRAQWQYRVSVLSYNPGERLSDDQRAAQFERLLNENARQGWEPVGSLLSRTTVQTVGGGVTTRDSTSFVAFRRPAGR